MLGTVVLAAALAVVPLAVVVLLGAVAHAVAGERVESPVAGIALVETAFLLVAGVYLAVAGGGVALRLGPPSPADVALALAFVPFPFALGALADRLTEPLGVEPRSTLEFTDESLLFAVVVALLLVGPAEELLYRGVVQDLLVGTLGTAGGVTVAAGLFGVVHYPSYGAESARDVDAGVMVGTVRTALVGGGLGAMYVVTGTLLAPVLAHSLYDAVLFVRVHRGAVK